MANVTVNYTGNGARSQPPNARSMPMTMTAMVPTPPSATLTAHTNTSTFAPQMKYASSRGSQKTLVPTSPLPSSNGQGVTNSTASRTARIAAAISSPNESTRTPRQARRPQSAPPVRMAMSPSRTHAALSPSPPSSSLHATHTSIYYSPPSSSIISPSLGVTVPSPSSSTSLSMSPSVRSSSSIRPQSARVIRSSVNGTSSSYRPAITSAWNSTKELHMNMNGSNGSSSTISPTTTPSVGATNGTPINQPPWLVSGRVIRSKRSTSSLSTHDRRRRAQVDALSFLRNSSSSTSSSTTTTPSVSAATIAAANRDISERDHEYHDIFLAIKRQLRGHGSQVHRAAWTEYWARAPCDDHQRHDAHQWLDDYYVYHRQRRAQRAQRLGQQQQPQHHSPPPPPLPTSELPLGSTAHVRSSSPSRTRTIPFQSASSMASIDSHNHNQSSMMMGHVYDEKHEGDTPISYDAPPPLLRRSRDSHDSAHGHRSRHATQMNGNGHSHGNHGNHSNIDDGNNDDMEPFRTGGMTDAERLQRDTALRLENGLPRSQWRPPGAPAHYAPSPSQSGPSSPSPAAPVSAAIRSPVPPSTRSTTVVTPSSTSSTIGRSRPTTTTTSAPTPSSSKLSKPMASSSMDDAMSPAPPMNRHVVQSDWSDQMVEIMIRCRDIPNPSLHHSRASSPASSPSSSRTSEHDKDKNPPFSLSVGVFLQERNGEFKLCGYTERIKNDSNPSFRRTFHLPRADYSLRLSVYDTSTTRQRDESNRLASAVINTRFLLQSKRVEYDLSDVSGEEGMWGKLVVGVVEAATAGSSSDDDDEVAVQQPALPPSLNLYVGCRGLRAAAAATSLHGDRDHDTNGMGIAVAFFAKAPGDTRFEFIAQTEVTPMTGDPIFDDFFRLPLLPSITSSLSSNDPPFEDQTLRFAVYSEPLHGGRNGNGAPTLSANGSGATKHALIGSVVVSLRDLLTSNKQQCVFNLFKGGQVIMGQFIVLRKHRRVARKRLTANGNGNDGDATAPSSTLSINRRIDMDDNGDIHIHTRAAATHGSAKQSRHHHEHHSTNTSPGRSSHGSPSDRRSHSDNDNDDNDSDGHAHRRASPSRRVDVDEDSNHNTGGNNSPRDERHHRRDDAEDNESKHDDEPIAVLRPRAVPSSLVSVPVISRLTNYGSSSVNVGHDSSSSTAPSSTSDHQPLYMPSSSTTTPIVHHSHTRSGSQSNLLRQSSAGMNGSNDGTTSNTNTNGGQVIAPANYGRTGSISRSTTGQPSSGSFHHHVRGSSMTSISLPQLAAAPIVNDSETMMDSASASGNDHSVSSHTALSPFTPVVPPAGVHTGRYSLSFKCELPHYHTINGAPSTYIEVCEVEHHSDGSTELALIGQTDTITRHYRPAYDTRVDLQFTAGRDPLLMYTLWQATPISQTNPSSPTNQPMVMARCQAPLLAVLKHLREPQSYSLQPNGEFTGDARLFVTAYEWQPPPPAAAAAAVSVPASTATAVNEPIWSAVSPAARGHHRRASTSITSSMAVMDATSPRHQQPPLIAAGTTTTTTGGHHSRQSSRTLLPPTLGRVGSSSNGSSGGTSHDANQLISPPGRMGPLFTTVSTDSNGAAMATTPTTMGRRPSVSMDTSPHQHQHHHSNGNGTGATPTHASSNGMPPLPSSSTRRASVASVTSVSSSSAPMNGSMYAPYTRVATPPTTVEPEPIAGVSHSMDHGDSKRGGMGMSQATTTENTFQFPDGLLPLHQAIRGSNGTILCDTCRTNDADVHCHACQGYNYCISHGCDGHAHARGTNAEKHERVSLRDMPPHLKLMSSYRQPNHHGNGNGVMGAICGHCHIAAGVVYCATCHQVYCHTNGCDHIVHAAHTINHHHQRTPIIDTTGAISGANMNGQQQQQWPPAHGWPDWMATSDIRLGDGQYPCDQCRRLPAAIRCLTCHHNVCITNGCDQHHHQHQRRPLLLYDPLADSTTGMNSTVTSAGTIPATPPGVRSPSPAHQLSTPSTTAPPSRQPTPPPPPPMVPSPQHNLMGMNGTGRRPSIATPIPHHARTPSNSSSNASATAMAIAAISGGHQLHARSPSAQLSPMGTAKCDNCSKPGAAVHRCGECDRNLCTPCDTSTHKVGKMRGHDRWPYGTEPPSSLQALFGPPAAPPTGSTTMLGSAGSSIQWSLTSSGSIAIPPGAIVCDECERAPAVWYCAEHGGKHYCDAKKCDADMHLPEKYRHHHRTRIPLPSASSSSPSPTTGMVAPIGGDHGTVAPPHHQRRSSISRPEPPNITEMRRLSIHGGAGQGMAAAAVTAAMIGAGIPVAIPSPRHSNNSSGIEPSSYAAPSSVPSVSPTNNNHRRDVSISLLPGQVLCSSCERAPAVWHCIEHDENYCDVNNCDAEQHHHTKYRDHHRDRLPLPSVTPSWSDHAPIAPQPSRLRTLAIREGQQLCGGCESAPATVYCEECDLYLCDIYNCNHEHHTALKKRDHHRRILPHVPDTARIITPGSAEPSPRGGATTALASPRSAPSLQPMTSVPSPRSLAPPSHNRRESFVAPAGLSRCDQCEAAIAVWYCPDHQQNFCDDNDCDRDAHAPTKLHGHKRVRLPALSTPTHSQTLSVTAASVPPASSASAPTLSSSASIGAGNGSGNDAPQCEICEEKAATVQCITGCKQMQCDDCSNDKHSMAKFRHHTVTPLPSSTRRASGSSASVPSATVTRQPSIEPFNVMTHDTPLSIDMTGGAGRIAQHQPTATTETKSSSSTASAVAVSSITDSPRLGPRMMPPEPLSINSFGTNSGSGSATNSGAVTPIPPSAINIIPPTPLPPTNRTIIPAAVAASTAPSTSSTVSSSTSATTPSASVSTHKSSNDKDTPAATTTITTATTTTSSSTPLNGRGPSLFAARNAETAAAASAASAVSASAASTTTTSVATPSSATTTTPSPSSSSSSSSTTVDAKETTVVRSWPVKTGTAMGQCDLCESQRAVWSCRDCHRDYCDRLNCWNETHMITRLKTHTRVPYDANSHTTTSTTATLAPAPAPAVTSTSASPSPPPPPPPSVAPPSKVDAPSHGDVKPIAMRACNNCSTAMAVYYCNDCHADYCTMNQCDMKVHQHDKTRDHKRVLIVPSPSPSSSSSPPSPPPSSRATAVPVGMAAMAAATAAAMSVDAVKPAVQPSTSDAMKGAITAITPPPPPPPAPATVPATPSSAAAATMNVPSQATITGAIPECEICEDAPATVYCNECKQYQCGTKTDGCDYELHKNAKMSSHHRYALIISNKNNQVDGAPLPGAAPTPTPTVPASASVTAATTVSVTAASPNASANPSPSASPRNSGHTGAPLSLEEEVTCDICDEQIAICHCPQCKENHCGTCDTDMHSNARTKGHIRQPITIVPRNAAAAADAHKRSVSTMGHPDLKVSTHSRTPSVDTSKPSLGVPVPTTAAGTASPSVTPKAAPAVIICDICEDAAAIVYCDECKQNLCRDNNCDVDTHMSAKNKSHKRTPLPLAPSSSNGTNGGVASSPSAKTAASVAPSTTSPLPSPSASALPIPQASPRASPSPPPATHECDNCDATAVVHCAECKQYFCTVNGCDTEIHSNARTKGHIRVPIGSAAATPATPTAATPSAGAKLAIPASSPSNGGGNGGVADPKTPTAAPPLTPSATASSATKVMCDSCDEEPAMYRCDECKQNLCGASGNNCESDLHQAARMASHRRVLLSSAAAATPAATATTAATPTTTTSALAPVPTSSPSTKKRVVCDNCDEEDATVWCGECSQNLCSAGGCDQDLHANARTKNHTRKSL